MTAEQGCEGRDEFTNGSPRDQGVWGEEEVGRGEWVTVHDGEGGRVGGGLSRASEGKLSAVQPGFSIKISALCCDVQIKQSDGTSTVHHLLVNFLL